MTDLDGRLVRCISSVLPNLTDEDIQKLDLVHLTDIDSLAAVTLVSLIDEEFGVALESDRLMDLGSFGALRQYLYEKQSGSRADEQRNQ